MAQSVIVTVVSLFRLHLGGDPANRRQQTHHNDEGEQRAGNNSPLETDRLSEPADHQGPSAGPPILIDTFTLITRPRISATVAFWIRL